MANHLFIIGAGASVSAGAPVMVDFLDKAKMIWASNHATSKESFERVFKAIGKLQLVHSKAHLDIVNLESVFNAFEMAKLTGGFADLSSENINQIMDDFKLVILETLEDSIKFPVESGNFVRAPKDYNDFASIFSKHIDDHTVRTKHNFAFISFNYDIALDQALMINGLNPQYYLNDPPSDCNSVPLLKLHGSCNWTSDADRKSIIPLELKDYWRHYSYNGYGSADIKIEISKHLKEYFHKMEKEISGEIIVVPPTWNKTSYGGGLQKVWIEARKQFSKADHIHIIGYSFPSTDMYFGLLYAIGTVSDIPLGSINIYNPDGSHNYVERARSLLGQGALGRLKMHECKFDVAIKTIREKIKIII